MREGSLLDSKYVLSKDLIQCFHEQYISQLILILKFRSKINKEKMTKNLIKVTFSFRCRIQTENTQFGSHASDKSEINVM